DGLQLRALASHSVKLDTITLRRPVVHVVQTPDGRFNLSSLMKKSQAKRQAGGKPWHIEIGAIVLEDGALTLRTRGKAPGPVTVVGLGAHVTVDWRGDSGAIGLDKLSGIWVERGLVLGVEARLRALTDRLWGRVALRVGA